MKLEMIHKIRQILTLDIILQVCWIPCVILIFHFIEDRKIAGLVAGAGFIILPIVNIFYVLEHKQELKFYKILISILFLVSNALPLFLLRIFNWSKNLEEIILWNNPDGAAFTARNLHAVSNSIYLGMILGYLVINFIKLKKLDKSIIAI